MSELMVSSVDDLAQAIRTVDGAHSLGAGALAEALIASGVVRIATEFGYGQAIWDGDGDDDFYVTKTFGGNPSRALDEGQFPVGRALGPWVKVGEVVSYE